MNIELESTSIHKAVHNLLRSLSGQGEAPATLLDNFLLVKQEASTSGVPTGRPYTTRQVVVDQLETLAAQDETAADILRWRFLNNRTLIWVAHKRNVSEYTISRMQNVAIEKLAKIIQQVEIALRQAQLDNWRALMPPATYSHLFGLDEPSRLLAESLLGNSDPPVIALVGIGGIGKTALADAVTRTVMEQFHFSGIHWLRPEPPTMSGAALSPDHLLDLTLADLAQSLDIRPVPPTPEERRQVVRQRLNAAPHLVIVDNLEDAAFVDHLPEHLVDLATPSKFLLTCRPKPGGLTPVRRFILPELSLANSAALIRHHAAEIGLTELAAAGDDTMEQIYVVTGGNPLALKLVVGMADRVSLPQLLRDLTTGRAGRIAETYRLIYRQTWQTLSQPARDLLQAMPLVSGDGGNLHYLQRISGLDENNLALARDELVKRSLLEVRGTLDEKLFGIHRLTETFLRTDIIDWPEE